MAIAFDAASAAAGNSASSVTWAHTCTGSNRVLLVSTGADGAATGVTYAGIAMTKLAERSGDGAQVEQLWGLVAPATGANNIIASFTGSATRRCQASSYTGVSQTGLPDSFNSDGTTAGTSLSVSTQVVASNCWLVGGTSADTSVLVAGAGTTFRADNSADEGGGIFHVIHDSNTTVSTGSQAQAVTWTGANDTSMCVVSIAPAGAAAVVNTGATLMALSAQ